MNCLVRDLAERSLRLSLRGGSSTSMQLIIARYAAEVDSSQTSSAWRSQKAALKKRSRSGLHKPSNRSRKVANKRGTLSGALNSCLGLEKHSGYLIVSMSGI